MLVSKIAPIISISEMKEQDKVEILK
jgi:hypothetical protein